jgi:hypothetical protein
VTVCSASTLDAQGTVTLGVANNFLKSDPACEDVSLQTIPNTCDRDVVLSTGTLSGQETVIWTLVLPAGSCQTATFTHRVPFDTPETVKFQTYLYATSFAVLLSGGSATQRKRAPVALEPNDSLSKYSSGCLCVCFFFFFVFFVFFVIKPTPTSTASHQRCH